VIRCGKPYGQTPAYTTSITLNNKANYKIEIKQVCTDVRVCARARAVSRRFAWVIAPVVMPVAARVLKY
jgi:hypothetical protein